jgi:hypothetical protein
MTSKQDFTDEEWTRIRRALSAYTFTCRLAYGLTCRSA